MPRLLCRTNTRPFRTPALRAPATGCRTNVCSHPRTRAPTHSRYRQIEDLRDSVAFAQIMDAAVPDVIPLDLFDYNASSYESYYRNASLLRAALDSVDLSSAGIDPDKIAVGQLEANFSLL